MPYAFGVVFMCGVCWANGSAEITEALITFGIIHTASLIKVKSGSAKCRIFSPNIAGITSDE